MSFRLPLTIVASVFLSIGTLKAQETFTFERDLQLVIEMNGAPLSNPWTGGLTAPQFSRIDVDFDGDLDLFIFDRDGSRVLIFTNEDPTPGAMHYKYAPEYTTAFPALKEWALLRDYDCDGKPDIFTNFQSSIKVYKNISTPETGLTFELLTSQLPASFDFGSGPMDLPMVCLSMDLPIIGDHDDDGDIDIITFTESATTLYYFMGMGADNGNCSEPSFKCVNRCYGMFAESTESNLILYGEDFQCPFQVVDPRSHEFDASSRLHAGGTLCDIDVDQNGIKDIIIGDVTFNNLTLMRLEHNADDLDETVEVDDTFPANYNNTLAVNLQRFPAAFYEDVNNDGVPDLLVAPNSRFDGDDDHSVLLYLNNGEVDLPDFTFVQDNFLQDGMIDVGRGAYPVMTDYNGDGKRDLVVANKEYFEDIDVLPSQLALFENTGSASSPKFTLVDPNWLNIPSYTLESIYPAFGDLDGDGDDDLVLGEETGLLHYFENVPVNGQANYTLDLAAMADAQGQIIDVGQFSTPQLFDVDDDGLLDLLIGEKLGLVNFFRNTGTAQTPMFTRVQGAAGDSLGGVSATTYLGINGYSVPQMMRDATGEMHLFLGNETGTIQLFNNIANNLDGLFTEETFILDTFREGDRSAVWVEDVDGDEKFDLFYGINNGGLIFFAGEIIDNINELGEENNTLEVYPNPASKEAFITLPGNELHAYTLYDQTGRQVMQGFGSSTVRIQLQGLAQGMYVVVVKENNRLLTGKLVVE